MADRSNPLMPQKVLKYGYDFLKGRSQSDEEEG
jgi:hypothetical protein